MKTRYFFLCIISMLFFQAGGQSFQNFIDRLNQLPSEQRQPVVDSFLTVNPHSPFKEADTLANFFYTGNVQSVSVPGDATGWDPGPNIMTHIDGTNFWYFSAVYENDARLDYKFVTNGSNWILDPRNPNSVNGGFGPNSELSMPGYTQPAEIEYDPGIGHGVLFDTVFFSTGLGNSRHIKVYTPPAYNQELKEYAVILFHDGLDYLSLADAKNVLDYLIGHDMIDPVIGVFVPAVNRNEEYHGNLKDEYTDFIVTDVMGWVDSKYRTLTDPQFRATAGASDGGNISLWIGMNHPDVFGNVAAYSSNVISEIASTFENGPVLNLKLYLDIGTYDIPVLIPMVHNFRDIVEARGYNHLFYEWHEGHSWGNWRAHIDNALQFFFPHANSVGNLNTDYFGGLLQCFPNPATYITTISFSGKIGRESELSIVNGLGETITVIWKGKLKQEYNLAEFDTNTIKPGIYFLKYRTDNKTISRKLIIQ